MDDFAPALAGEVGLASAAIGDDLIVEPVKRPVGLGGPDLVGHRLGERAELSLALFQRLQHPTLFGDILHDTDKSGRTPRLIAFIVGPTGQNAFLPGAAAPDAVFHNPSRLTGRAPGLVRRLAEIVGHDKRLHDLRGQGFAAIKPEDPAELRRSHDGVGCEV